MREQESISESACTCFYCMHKLDYIKPNEHHELTVYGNGYLLDSKITFHFTPKDNIYKQDNMCTYIYIYMYNNDC